VCREIQQKRYHSNKCRSQAQPAYLGMQNKGQHQCRQASAGQVTLKAGEWQAAGTIATLK